MRLRIEPGGRVRCLYDEVLDLACLGTVLIRRASHVEPDSQGAWWADLSPVGGPRIGPFAKRSLALEDEQVWLEEHWLTHTAPPTP